MGENELPALNSQYLGETQLMYCVDSQHRLADKTAIDMKDIDKDPLILFSMGYYHQQVLRNRFLRDHITPNILFNSNQVMTIKGFVRNAIANAFLLPQVIEEKDGIIMIPFKDPMKLNVAVIWRKDAFITKEADSFINFVSSRFKH
jgi:DNA-binding transcriptional LysR family regulator